MKSRIALNWIDNKWVDSNNHKKSLDPASGEVIGTYADGGKPEAVAAVAAAKKSIQEFSMEKRPAIAV